MALLVSSVFGATGCGSDDDVAVESRVKNAAPEASGLSDAISEADCNLLDLYDDLDDRFDLRLDDRLDRLDLIDLLDIRDLLDDLDNRLDSLDLRDLLDLIDLGGLDDRLDLGGLDDLLDRLDDPDFRDFLDNRLEQLGQCAAALRSGNYAPEGDDVDGG
jgi:hypothetical protein